MRQRLARDPLTIAVSLVLLAIVFISLGAPLVTHYDPYAGNVMMRLKPIGTAGHWLGTDETGRDLWTRLCYGGRLSLLAGILPVTISLLIGGFLGILAGYAGGLVGTLIMRTMDVFYAFPSILLAIAICGLLGNGLSNSILALAVVFIPPMVRISETVTTQARQLDFVEAARASGTTTLQVIRYHVLANVLGSDPGLCHEPDQPLDHPVRRPVVPGPGRDAAAGGMGADAELAAPGDLRAALCRRAAGPDDLYHLDVFQHGERWIPLRHGCEAEQMTRKRIQPPAMARFFCRCAFAVTLLSDGHSP